MGFLMAAGDELEMSSGDLHHRINNLEQANAFLVKFLCDVNGALDGALSEQDNSLRLEKLSSLRERTSRLQARLGQTEAAGAQR